MPTELAAFAGPRIDEPVSSANEHVTKFAATDVPEPVLEIPASRSVS
jgi:hypothetical protein